VRQAIRARQGGDQVGETLVELLVGFLRLRIGGLLLGNGLHEG
jgi:hypothetical protein